MKQITALLLIANGLDELEYFMALSVFESASFKIHVAKVCDSEEISKNLVQCLRGAVVEANFEIGMINSFIDISDIDLVVMFGGTDNATETMKQSSDVRKWLQSYDVQEEDGENEDGSPIIPTPPTYTIALNGSATVVLHHTGYFMGSPIVFNQSLLTEKMVEETIRDMKEDYKCLSVEEYPYTVDKNKKFLTSGGQGSTFELALGIVDILLGTDFKETIRTQLFFPATKKTIFSEIGDGSA